MKQLGNDTRENVAAIDGLYQWHGQLIGVQNVTTPGRVDPHHALARRRRASPRCRRCSRTTTIASTSPPPARPRTTASSCSPRPASAHYNDEGKIEEADKVPKPTIVRVLLNRLSGR